MLEEISDSAVEVARELAKLASTQTRWHSIIKNMLFASPRVRKRKGERAAE